MENKKNGCRKNVTVKYFCDKNPTEEMQNCPYFIAKKVSRLCKHSGMDCDYRVCNSLHAQVEADIAWDTEQENKGLSRS